jgi:hypothetical protein
MTQSNCIVSENSHTLHIRTPILPQKIGGVIASRFPVEWGETKVFIFPEGIQIQLISNAATLTRLNFQTTTTFIGFYHQGQDMVTTFTPMDH